MTICCESVERWLERNAGAAPPLAVAEHLSRCRSCRRERDGGLFMRGLLESHEGRGAEGREGRPSASADPLFVRAVMARVRGEIPPVRRGERATWRKVTVVALLSVATVLGAWAWERAGVGTGSDGAPLAEGSGLAAVQIPPAGEIGPTHAASRFPGESDRFLWGDSASPSIDGYIRCTWIPAEREPLAAADGEVVSF
ncbi:MAG: hypothetical protein ACE5GW_08995 [Planctomycetota bacterium]